jgi:ketosteroid isomerase-like protein
MGQAKQLTERWWALYTQDKVDDANALFAPDIHFRGPGVEFSGRDALAPYIGGFAEAFADLAVTFKAVVDGGDQCWTELEITGRDKQSGKTMKWYAGEHVRATNGHIVSWSAFWDRIGFGTKGAV